MNENEIPRDGVLIVNNTNARITEEMRKHLVAFAAFAEDLPEIIEDAFDVQVLDIPGKYVWRVILNWKEEKPCRGHESTSGPAGISVYCNGACR